MALLEDFLTSYTRDVFISVDLCMCLCRQRACHLPTTLRQRHPSRVVGATTVPATSAPAHRVRLPHPSRTTRQSVAALVAVCSRTGLPPPPALTTPNPTAPPSRSRSPRDITSDMDAAAAVTRDGGSVRDLARHLLSKLTRGLRLSGISWQPPI